MATVEISEEAQEGFLDVFSSLYDESSFEKKNFSRKLNS
jgi:hypothetical protein